RRQSIPSPRRGEGQGEGAGHALTSDRAQVSRLRARGIRRRMLTGDSAMALGQYLAVRSGASNCRDALFMAAIATIPRLTSSRGPGLAPFTASEAFASPSPSCLIAQFRPAGRLTFFACAKKVSKETHPGIRV